MFTHARVCHVVVQLLYREQQCDLIKLEEALTEPLHGGPRQPDCIFADREINYEFHHHASEREYNVETLGSGWIPFDFEIKAVRVEAPCGYPEIENV